MSKVKRMSESKHFNGANGRRRQNNTGTLERRGDRWLARWYVYTPQGTRKRMSKILTATSLDAARKELATLTDGNALITRERQLEKIRIAMEGVREELQQVYDAPPALALDNMFAAFVRDPNRPQCGDATLRMYESQAEHFIDWVGKHYPEVREMRQVSRGIAEEFLAHISATFSPNTYNKYVVLLRLIWSVIGNRSEARCTVNPWDGVRRKAEPKTNGRRSLTVDELCRVTANLDGEMRLLFALGIYTGLRLGDCATMDWGKIDLARGYIVTTPRKTAKTGREVEIPIHPALAGMLSDIPDHKRHGYVLPDTAATYVRGTCALSQKIRALFENAGIKTSRKVPGYSRAAVEVGFHSLRHSFVSLMGNAGAPLALVQSIVGHSNPMMTAHYFHARGEALANAVAQLPAVMGDNAVATQSAVIDVDATEAPVALSPVLARFRALLDEMTPEERAEAARMLATLDWNRQTCPLAPL